MTINNQDTSNNIVPCLSDDSKFYTLENTRKEINPSAVFIGRKHPNLSYGQTGVLLFDEDNNPLFLPDDDSEDTIKEYKINTNDAVRTNELLINPQPYS